jgi:aryl-alcohol dehydrogenase-like predicted oxidoreductase
MIFREISGIGDVSRLVLGTSGMRTPRDAFPILDAFASAGGNCLDTAYAYGHGVCEEVVGRWLSAQGPAAGMIVIVKGGHTPHCTPEGIRRQLQQSLERMGIDRADIYMPHRDNPSVPVGEFVDVLDELRERRLLSTFGVSNWTTDRIAAANEYARANKRSEIVAVSNNFALAKMVDPVFPGSVPVVSAQSRVWFRIRQIPLMPWSSQGRRFFTTPLERLHLDEEVVRCWLTPANLERRRRATVLARARGVPSIEVALAYVLHQPFPTFPIIGPQSAQELEASLHGLTIQLENSEMRWLDLKTSRNGRSFRRQRASSSVDPVGRSGALSLDAVRGAPEPLSNDGDVRAPHR